MDVLYSYHSPFSQALLFPHDIKQLLSAICSLYRRFLSSAMKSSHSRIARFPSNFLFLHGTYPQYEDHEMHNVKNINIYLPPVLPALSLDNPHTGSKVPAASGLQSLFLFRPTPLNLQDQHILPLQTLPSPRSIHRSNWLPDISCHLHSLLQTGASY